MANIFITGGSGYIGRHLIPALLARGHRVRGLVRRRFTLPRGAEEVMGNALDASTFAEAVAAGDTFVQLVGVAHPSPAKAQQFRDIDLVSVQQSVRAATEARVGHFVYLSVAQPAPIMREYVAVRAEGERLITESGLDATFIRPWYVLGPGHRWPYLLLPFYWLFRTETSRRLHPVKLMDVVRAMVAAIEQPPEGVRIIEAPEMRRGGAPRPDRPPRRSPVAV
ncbi:MAG TPA: NAD(P)H-binding protein [Thermoanaerobaculia bacterium]|nr:NAD(P)H-binding protein [Thermoanaerobaculia bacterium]